MLGGREGVYNYNKLNDFVATEGFNGGPSIIKCFCWERISEKK